VTVNVQITKIFLTAWKRIQLVLYQSLCMLLFFISICVLIVLALFKICYFLYLYEINDLICSVYP